MSKFSKISKFSKTQWNDISTVLMLMKQARIKIDFPRNYIWQGVPVGEFLETIRELRSKDMLTKEVNLEL